MSNGADVSNLVMSNVAPRDDAALQMTNMANLASLASSANAAALERDYSWFAAVLQSRLASYFAQPDDTVPAQASITAHVVAPEKAAPDLSADTSEYAALLRDSALSNDERLVFLLALAPHVRPQVLDLLFVRNKNLERGFTEFGGAKGRSHGGFLPTGETAVFLLALGHVQRRFDALRLFDEQHAFHRDNLLRIEHDGSGEPRLSGALVLSSEALERVTTGARNKPDFSVNFPAKLISTHLKWSDLVLAREVMDEVQGIKTWLANERTLMDDWGLARAVKPGYRCLFYGPPGTGKTLTATLLGQEAQTDVYRIDLSMVVSKFIGETEKNLAAVFDQAASRRWILFFDEADALFGKRTATTSSNDRYANQEVSYLLQRVEDFPGTVILATNLKANIDDAFARRFQSMVYFPMPEAPERERLWAGMLTLPERLEKSVDLGQLALAHELSGGAIANVVRQAALLALRSGRQAISSTDLSRSVSRELRKEGRTL